MKLIFVVGALVLSTTLLHGQAIMSLSRSTRVDGRNITTNLASKDTSAASSQALSIFKLRIDKTAGQKSIADSLMLQKIVDTLNASPSVKVLANGGISNMEDFRNAYGSLGVGLQFRISKYKLRKNGWIDPHYLYIMFNTKSASSPDSGSIQKTFMFPELNKRDFVLGYFQERIRNDWHLGWTFEFSLNRIGDSVRDETTNTTKKREFVSQNFMLGYRVSKAFPLDALKTQAFLQAQLYYNLINVDPKYFADYDSLTQETHIHPSFHSLGLQTSVQVDNLILFCNMKYILNKQGEIKSPNLVRFIYTVGTMLTL